MLGEDSELFPLLIRFITPSAEGDATTAANGTSTAAAVAEKSRGVQLLAAMTLLPLITKSRAAVLALFAYLI